MLTLFLVGTRANQAPAIALRDKAISNSPGRW